MGVNKNNKNTVKTIKTFYFIHSSFVMHVIFKYERYVATCDIFNTCI